ncbi:MAG: glycosyltransferase family 39 protein [Anaerolineae bacterium]
MDGRTQTTTNRTTCWLLLALFLLAFALRIYRLDYADLSGDETWSVMVAGGSLADVVASEAGTHPPLYHLLLHFNMQLAGRSVFSIRYLSVLWSMFTLAFIKTLGQVVGGRRVGLLALAVGAISPFLIYYAQDARMYAVPTAGMAGSMTVFMVLVRQMQAGRRPTRRTWLLYALTSLIGAYSHYYAFAILLAQAAYVAYLSLSARSWSLLKPWILTWGAMGILFIPWPLRHLNFLGGKASHRFEEWNGAKFLEIVRRTSIAYGAGITLPPAERWLGWIAVGIALLGLAGLIRSRGRRAVGAALGVVLFGGFLFAWAVNPIMPFYYERYLLAAAPVFLAALATGLWFLAHTWKPAAIVAAVGILAASALSLRHFYFDETFLKGSYGRLITDLTSHARPGDIILLNNPLQQPAFDYYRPPDLPAQTLSPSLLVTEAGTDALLRDITAGYQRAWLIETGNAASFDPEHHVQQWLGQHGSRGYTRNHANGNLLYLFVLSSVGESGRHPINANINDQVLLESYSLSAPIAQAGDNLLITLHWKAIAPMERDYTVFTHLIDEGGQLWAQTDGQPGGGSLPTHVWQPGEPVEDNYAILLPGDLQPGTYTLRVGMYLWPELTRLPVVDAAVPVVDEAIVLGTIDIQTQP